MYDGKHHSKLFVLGGTMVGRGSVSKSVTTAFVEQPLVMPGSANYSLVLHITLIQIYGKGFVSINDGV